MKNAVIACETLRDELNFIFEETGCSYPIIWVDSKYHIDPNALRTKLQEEIDEQRDFDNLLFAFGSCGNGLIDLKANTANLIIPKTDDCISMVLSKPGEKFERHKNTYFLTKGWMGSPKSIANEYRHSIKKYGKKRTKRLFDIMLMHYKYLMLIDTGAYNLEECRIEAQELSDNINLELITAQGDLWFLKKLLTGPYDVDFCLIKKGEAVKMDHFGYMGVVSTHQVL